MSYIKLRIYLLLKLVGSITKCGISNYTHNVIVVLQIRKIMGFLDKVLKMAFQVKQTKSLLFK
ncbi:hypothetical protein A3UG_10780 [Enterobacter cloacae subsp. dissolvens SDM]|nr:hypothetical protein A3UG_10780 [Enterobacter cloacae subsp. dissolvens SDM]